MSYFTCLEVFGLWDEFESWPEHELEHGKEKGIMERFNELIRGGRSTG